MRKFKLINATGAEYDMMRTDGFLYDPAGLGWGYETAVVDVGEAYIPTEKTYTRPAPSGSMIFKSYAVYNEFLRFIQAGGLTLAYMPLTSWRYLDVSVFLGKTEIKPDTNRLTCDISFSGLSHWYSRQKVYRTGDDNNYSAKRYTFQYSNNTPSGDYGYIYSSNQGRAEISNGPLSSYCKITIKGPATSPSWTLYDSNDTQIASGAVNATISAGRMLVINSRPSETALAEYDATTGAYVQNLYQNSDFTTERFIVIPPGEGYYMVFSDGGGGTLGECLVEVYERV